jgi:hypothetical protein
LHNPDRHRISAGACAAEIENSPDRQKRISGDPANAAFEPSLG